MRKIVNSTITKLASMLLMAAISSIVVAGDVDGGGRLDFQNDLIPVFTKNGCNTGACHGAAIGRGGFQLSLYGGDPKSDYKSIVQQLSGRRINLTKPDQSLIVLKPAEFIAHGGGTIFDADSESAQRLINWISQGAHYAATRELSRIEVTPQKQVASKTGEVVELHATAHYSDGSTADVTRWTIFNAEDTSAVEVDIDAATLKVLRRGRHVVVARFLSEVVPIEIIVPLTDIKPNLANEIRTNFIDDEVFATLESLGLPPSSGVDDATFLRRICLDLTGRLPSTSPLAQQLNRQQLVDKLLTSTEFNDYWTLQLARLLRIRAQVGDATSANNYHRWLNEQIASKTSYDKLAVTLITANGDSNVEGPPNFYRTAKDARGHAEFFSELFMGSRLRCANCHNHPLDKWTQDDYHGLAAIFAKVEPGQLVKPRPTGQVIHPRTLEPAALRIPGEQFLSPESVDGRQQLADWLTARNNPYFAKAIVNRLWKYMMGRGLVEPVDDFRATNPATHPVLLSQLADDFVANGYDLRHTLRLIANSTTYARSANATAVNKDDDRFYSHSIRRSLQPEVLADAISDVLGIAEQYGAVAKGTRAVALVDPQTPSRTLDVLGRCGREESCESSVGAVGGLPQQLHLLNGGLLNDRIAASGSRLRTLLEERRKPMAIVSEFYLAALSRPPSVAEHQYWQDKLKKIDDPQEQSAFLQDFVWGLLTCQEFVTNH